MEKYQLIIPNPQSKCPAPTSCPSPPNRPRWPANVPLCRYWTGRSGRRLSPCLPTAQPSRGGALCRLCASTITRTAARDPEFAEELATAEINAENGRCGLARRRWWPRRRSRRMSRRCGPRWRRKAGPWGLTIPLPSSPKLPSPRIQRPPCNTHRQRHPKLRLFRPS